MRAMRKQLNELQSLVTAEEEEIKWLREKLNDLQGQDEHFREQQQLVTELQSSLQRNQEEMRTLRQQQRETQQKETGPREWLINRNEIQFTDQELGRGAWGIVYRGKLHGCDVAVKQMYESIMSDHNRHLFEREVDIASKCRHPCLLQFLGATGDDGTPLLITELMDCSLREKLYWKDDARLSPEEVSIISVDVAAVVNYLHQKSLPIIHRDISSANVLLRQQGYQWRAKLSDYGTVNFVRQSTRNDTGAAIYSAPETMRKYPDRPISCKVDVYSFGVLLCEMCIREQPDPQQREGQISRIRNTKFQTLVMRCVQREPGERPNMGEIIEELEHCNRDRGTKSSSKSRKKVDPHSIDKTFPRKRYKP